MSVTNLVVNGWSVLGQGDGVPDSSLGDNGNFYLNLSNDTLYQKLGGEWVALVAMSGDGGVPSTRTISTSAPISGGGALSSNLTLSMLSATPARNGYMTLAQAGAVADLSQGIQLTEAVSTGALDPNTPVSFLENVGAGAFTLAAGTNGQFKTVVQTSADTATLTAALRLNTGSGASYVLLGVGSFLHMVYSDSLAEWVVLANFTND